jgi:hypothetical protein
VAGRGWHLRMWLPPPKPSEPCRSFLFLTSRWCACGVVVANGLCVFSVVVVSQREELLSWWSEGGAITRCLLLWYASADAQPVSALERTEHASNRPSIAAVVTRIPLHPPPLQHLSFAKSKSEVIARLETGSKKARKERKEKEAAAPALTNGIGGAHAAPAPAVPAARPADAGVPSETLFVENLPEATTSDMLSMLFSQYNGACLDWSTGTTEG